MQTIIYVRNLTEELIKEIQVGFEDTRVKAEYNIEREQVIINGDSALAAVARKVILAAGGKIL